MTHTPGPWFVTPDGYRVFSKENQVFAKMICMTAHNISERTPEAKANAILCAVAPDLYEFAKTFLRTPIAGKGSEELLLRMAHTVIAKAEGKP